MRRRETRDSSLQPSNTLLGPAAAIVRCFIMYRPYVIFGGAAAVFAVLGMIPFVRYAILVAMGQGGESVHSLVLGAVLLILSFLIAMLGVIADLIRTNRTLLEAMLEHARRTKFDHPEDIGSVVSPGTHTLASLAAGSVTEPSAQLSR